MHTNESAENYLETILRLSKKLPVMRSVDVETEFNFKKIYERHILRSS